VWVGHSCPTLLTLIFGLNPPGVPQIPHAL
jgi:hypothetical protein